MSRRTNELTEDKPVHILSPCPRFLDVDSTFLVALYVFSLDNVKRITHYICQVVAEFTFVVPNPVTPIMAIIAASSSLTSSMASPSSLESGESGSRFGRPLEEEACLSGSEMASGVDL
jgi:hypothetical protein